MKNVRKIIAVALCLILAFSATAVLGYAAEAVAPTRITVSVKGDSSTTKGIAWFTKAEAETKAEVFKDGIDVTDSVSIADVSCSAWEGSYSHKLTITNLEPGTEYSFRVGDGVNWSDMGSFITDDGDSQFDFIAIADVQASNLGNFEKGAATLRAAFEVMPNAEFVANMGDYTNDSTNEEWDLFDQTFAQLNLMSTGVPVAGNHDGFGSGAKYWFSKMFNLDESESVQTKNGVNYSFDYGNAHFAVLNTNDMLSVSQPQLTWLKNDLNSTAKDWKIVFMHKSPYTLGKDGKWPDALFLQESLTEVLDECNVDLVMSGHDHMYLRTKQLKGNAVVEDGTTYVLSGTAGSKRYEIRSFLADSFMKTDFIAALTVQKNGYGNYWNGSDWNSKSDTNIGGCFNCISINGGELTLKSYILADELDENEEQVITEIDSFTLTKQEGQNVATFSGDNTTSKMQYLMGILPSFVKLAIYTFTKWLPTFMKILPRIVDVYAKEGTF